MIIYRTRSDVTPFARMLALAVALTASPVFAASYFVAVTGNDDHPGSQAQPFQTVNHAVKSLRPGDTLYLRGGTYYEQVKVGVNGTASQPITIAAYEDERPVIDSGYREFRSAGNSDWELVNASLGEYRSKRRCENDDMYAFVAAIPGYENERVVLVPYEKVAHFRAKTDSYSGSRSNFYVGPGSIVISGRCHIRLAKTTAMRNAEARYGKVFSTENADPGDYSIIVSQAQNTLRVSGAYLTFKDIAFNQAKRTIVLEAGAQHVRFEGITAWMGASAIQTYSSQVHDISVTGSRILGDAPYWIFWSDMKSAPRVANLLRGTSINLKGGTHDWVISRNLIRGSGQDLIGTNNGEHRIFVHHNRIENCGDDAFEIEGKAEFGGRDDIGHIQIYENYIANCLVAAAVGQDTRKMTGPLLFYRNVVVMLRDHPVNRKAGINKWNGGGQFGYNRMFKQAGSDYAANNVHYYNNTLVMLNAQRGVTPTPIQADGSTFANNIVAMINGKAVDEYNTGADQLIDGNLYWKVNADDGVPLVGGQDSVTKLQGVEQNSISAEPKSGSDPQFSGFSVSDVRQTGDKWTVRKQAEVLEPANFVIAKTSPARAKAVSVSCRKVRGSNQQGQSLCNDGKLPDSQKSSDIGALPAAADLSAYRGFPFRYAATPDPAPVIAEEDIPPQAPELTVRTIK